MLTEKQIKSLIEQARAKKNHTSVVGHDALEEFYADIERILSAVICEGDPDFLTRDCGFELGETKWCNCPTCGHVVEVAALKKEAE